MTKMMKIDAMLTVMVISFFANPGRSESAGSAPQLKECRASAPKNLGLWDDVWQGGEMDKLLLRRGAELFMLSPESEKGIKPLGTFPKLNNSQIIHGGHWAGRDWLFCSSPDRVPFALDITQNASLDFEIEGLKVPGDGAPGIQSWVTAPHAEAAILMISGGDKATWPLDGNRPIYYWMNFRTRECRSAPTGWDLQYLSADQSTAVFQIGGEVAAIDMKTGRPAVRIPDKKAERHVPFNWTNRDLAKPLHDAESRVVGLSLNGQTYPWDFRAGNPYIFSAKVESEWAAFHLRGHGEPRRDHWSLWFAPLKDSTEPKQMGPNIRDFEVLGPGRCVFVSWKDDDSRGTTEANVYDANAQTIWNVLEGVERLPKLPEKVANKSYVSDALRFNLVRGFGPSDESRFVLALATHYRGDSRAFTFRMKTTDEPPVPREIWRRGVLLSSAGERFLVQALPDEAFSPDKIWLHNSGTLVWGRIEWTMENAKEVRKLQLTHIDLTRAGRQ